MIGFSSGASIWLACGMTDLRNGFDGLAGLVQTHLSQDAFPGQLFVFRGRRGNRVSYCILLIKDRVSEVSFCPVK